MHLLYEEDGEFKVGTVLAQSPASFQVETPHGRRAKVKSSMVLLRFERPAAAELLAAAGEFAAGLDTDFLWQCSGQGEFGFEALAREYVGREPSERGPHSIRPWNHPTTACSSSSRRAVSRIVSSRGSVR